MLSKTHNSHATYEKTMEKILQIIIIFFIFVVK